MSAKTHPRDIIDNIFKYLDKPILICMVGQPGSGKSTWINQLILRYKEECGDPPVDKLDLYERIVSTDDFLELIAKREGLTYNDVVESHFKEAHRLFNIKVDSHIKDKKLIIWDQTNMSAKKRNKIANRVGKDYYKIIVTMPDNDGVIKQRREKREQQNGKHIPLHIVKLMKDHYQMPSFKIDKQYDCIIDVMPVGMQLFHLRNYFEN